jgi:hypothetical protein
MKKGENHRIACFISPHGYGHAARASGVIEALFTLDPHLGFDIFTQVPQWFLRHSIPGEFEYHSLLTDIGLVQETPLKANLKKTLHRLDQFLPLDPLIIHELAEFVRDRKCQLIVCDISPLGIKVAKEAGIPSVLVENFTWDWISILHDLLAFPRIQRHGPDGSAQVADFMGGLINFHAKQPSL